MGREEHCKQITGMCGKCSQCFKRTGFAPTHGMCSFMVYTSQALGWSAGELSEVGLGLSALPWSKLLRFRFSGTPQRRRLGWACILCPSQVRAAQATRCLASTVTPRCGASYHLLHPSCSDSWVAAGVPVSGMPCVSSGELTPGCDPPRECQPPRIPRSLGRQMGAYLQFCRGCPSGAEIAPFWLWLPPPASLSPASAQQLALWCSVLCSVSGPGSALG